MYSDWDETEEPSIRCSQRKRDGRPLGPSAPHYPGKPEATELRRIMAQTGLTEDEVRANKVYRIQLAQAAKGKQGNPARRKELAIKTAKRYIAKELNLPVWHPDVETRFRTKYEIRYGRVCYRW